MLKIYVLIMLVLCVFSLSAELVISENWNYTQGMEVTTDMAHFSINLPGGDILVVGGLGLQNEDNSYNVHPCATRFSIDGSILWQRSYTEIPNLQNVNSEVVYAAIRTNGNVFLGVELFAGGAYFLTIDPMDGELVSSAQIYTSLRSITLTTEDYVIIGSNFSVSNVVLSKYSLGGNFINSVSYDVPGTNDIVNSLTATSDGGFWLAGKQGSKALVVKFDSVMQVEEEYAFQMSSSFGYEAQRVFQDTNGSLFVAGQRGNEGIVFKVSSSGNVVWEYLGSRAFFDVAVLDNGYVVAAGVYGDQNNPRNSVAVVNDEGQYHWGDLPGYTGSYYGHFTHVAQTVANDFIVLGWRSTHTGTYGADWVVNHYHSWIDNDIIVTDIQPWEPNEENGYEVNIMAGSSKEFSITAYDPDGNPLHYNWFIAGDTVGTSSSYTFEAPIDEAGEVYYLFLYVSDQTRAYLFYQWQINITEYVNAPYPPYSLNPYNEATFVELRNTPTLSWGYSSDQTHNQTHCDVYFGTNQPAVANMNPSYKVLGDGETLYDTYNHPEALAMDQTYYWRVVVFNGEQQTIGDVWSFTTEPIIQDFPYLEDFEGQMAPPDGWKNGYSFDLSTPGQGMGGGWGMAFSDEYIHTGENAALVTPYQMPGYYWLKSPLFEIAEGSELSFWLNYQCSIDNPTYLYVMVQTESGWQSLHDFNSPAQSNVYDNQITLSLADYNNQTIRLAFVYYANWQALPVAIDDVTIDSVSLIPAVQNLVIEQVNGDIRLSWDSVSGASLYRILISDTPEGTQADIGISGIFGQIGNRITWTFPAATRGFFRVKAVSN